MKKKVAWLIVSCVMATALLLTSCGSAVTEEEEIVQEPPATETPAPTSPESQTVAFPDKNLEAAVRDALDKPTGEEITVAELAEITVLEADNSGIADISGLEYCYFVVIGQTY